MLGLNLKRKLTEALVLFGHGDQLGSSTTLSSILQDCAMFRRIQEGRILHSHTIKLGFTDYETSLLHKNLLNMYTKCGRIEDAWKVFDEMPCPNVVSWASKMESYSCRDRHAEALSVFTNMKNQGIKPAHSAIALALEACAEKSDLSAGKCIHGYLNKAQYGLDGVLVDRLLAMYSKCESIEEARQVFDKMPTRENASWNAMVDGYLRIGNVDEAVRLFERIPHHDLSSWNTMIDGFCRNEMFEEALRMFKGMKKSGIRHDNISLSHLLDACSGLGVVDGGKQVHSQIVVGGLEMDVDGIISLVEMYAKCKSLADASKLFNKFQDMKVPSEDKNSVTLLWNAMFLGYVDNGKHDKALEMISQMQKRRLEIDHFTFKSALHACGSLGSSEYGKQVHAHIITSGYEFHALMGSSLVGMYGKCSKIEETCKAFKRLDHRDRLSWCAMVVNCAQNGLCKEALGHVRGMVEEGLDPDLATYASIFGACASLPDLHQGKQVHGRFIKNGCQLNDHVKVSMMDMYWKCGGPKEAEMVLASIEVEPNLDTDDDDFDFDRVLNEMTSTAYA